MSNEAAMQRAENCTCPEPCTIHVVPAGAAPGPEPSDATEWNEVPGHPVDHVAPAAAGERDPHHDGCCEWKWEDGHFWQRCPAGAGSWTKVKRIHATRQRVMMLAALAASSAEREGLAALEWMVNVACGVGKSGGPPEPDEWKAALEAGQVALRVRPGEKKP